MAAATSTSPPATETPIMRPVCDPPDSSSVEAADEAVAAGATVSAGSVACTVAYWVIVTPAALVLSDADTEARVVEPAARSDVVLSAAADERLAAAAEAEASAADSEAAAADDDAAAAEEAEAAAAADDAEADAAAAEADDAEAAAAEDEAAAAAEALDVAVAVLAPLEVVVESLSSPNPIS